MICGEAWQRTFWHSHLGFCVGMAGKKPAFSNGMCFEKKEETIKFKVMTYVQLKTQPTVKGFNNFMTDFLPIVKENAAQKKPLVNIFSSEEGYTIEVFTPVFKKEELSVSFDKNLLTVSGQPDCKEDAKTGEKIRKEYQIESFSRSFNVDDKVDGENISAQYVNGVLTLNLPKKQPVKTPVKQITIL